MRSNLESGGVLGDERHKTVLRKCGRLATAVAKLGRGFDTVIKGDARARIQTRTRVEFGHGSNLGTRTTFGFEPGHAYYVVSDAGKTASKSTLPKQKRGHDRVFFVWQ